MAKKRQHGVLVAACAVLPLLLLLIPLPTAVASSAQQRGPGIPNRHRNGGGLVASRFPATPAGQLGRRAGIARRVGYDRTAPYPDLPGGVGRWLTTMHPPRRMGADALTRWFEFDGQQRTASSKMTEPVHLNPSKGFAPPFTFNDIKPKRPHQLLPHRATGHDAMLNPGQALEHKMLLINPISHKSYAHRVAQYEPYHSDLSRNPLLGAPFSISVDAALPAGIRATRASKNSLASTELNRFVNVPPSHVSVLHHDVESASAGGQHVLRRLYEKEPLNVGLVRHLQPHAELTTTPVVSGSSATRIQLDSLLPESSAPVRRHHKASEHRSARTRDTILPLRLRAFGPDAYVFELLQSSPKLLPSMRSSTPRANLALDKAEVKQLLAGQATRANVKQYHDDRLNSVKSDLPKGGHDTSSEVDGSRGSGQSEAVDSNKRRAGVVTVHYRPPVVREAASAHRESGEAGTPPETRSSQAELPDRLIPMLDDLNVVERLLDKMSDLFETSADRASLVVINHEMNGGVPPVTDQSQSKLPESAKSSSALTPPQLSRQPVKSALATGPVQREAQYLVPSEPLSHGPVLVSLPQELPQKDESTTTATGEPDDTGAMKFTLSSLDTMPLHRKLEEIRQKPQTQAPQFVASHLHGSEVRESTTEVPQTEGPQIQELQIQGPQIHEQQIRRSQIQAPLIHRPQIQIQQNQIPAVPVDTGLIIPVHQIQSHQVAPLAEPGLPPCNDELRRTMPASQVVSYREIVPLVSSN